MRCQGQSESKRFRNKYHQRFLVVDNRDARGTNGKRLSLMVFRVFHPVSKFLQLLCHFKMTGLNWTYESLSLDLPTTRHRLYLPVNLNPIMKQLLEICPGSLSLVSGVLLFCFQSLKVLQQQCPTSQAIHIYNMSNLSCEAT